MEILIKLDKRLYEYVKRHTLTFGEIDEICDAISNGTSLPKGHKRLIEDNFEVGPVFDDDGSRISYKYVTQEDLNNVPTIIEADKEG